MIIKKKKIPKKFLSYLNCFDYSYYFYRVKCKILNLNYKIKMHLTVEIFSFSRMEKVSPTPSVIE